jgi:hypothetical protein
MDAEARMSPDFEMLMKHLRERTAEVELDLPAPVASPDPRAAAKLARSRQVSINRGDRIARVHKSSEGTPQAASAASGSAFDTLVTETECRTLAAAGAKWVGPAPDAPTSRPYVETLRVRDFRCVRDVAIRMTPLHAFIGPNEA